MFYGMAGGEMNYWNNGCWFTVNFNFESLGSMNEKVYQSIVCACFLCENEL